VPVTLHLEAKRGNGDSASLEVRLDLSANSTDERLSLQALDLDGAGDARWRSARHQGALRGARGRRPISPKQTLSVPKFALTAAGADVAARSTARRSWMRRRSRAT